MPCFSWWKSKFPPTVFGLHHLLMNYVLKKNIKFHSFLVISTSMFFCQICPHLSLSNLQFLHGQILPFHGLNPKILSFSWWNPTIPPKPQVSSCPDHPSHSSAPGPLFLCRFNLVSVSQTDTEPHVIVGVHQKSGWKFRRSCAGFGDRKLRLEQLNQ